MDAHALAIAGWLLLILGGGCAWLGAIARGQATASPRRSFGRRGRRRGAAPTARRG